MIHIDSKQASAPRSQERAESAVPSFARVLTMNAALKRIARLEADLLECREYLETEVDVNDGDYGEQAPNRAMTLVTMIDQTLNGAPV